MKIEIKIAYETQFPKAIAESIKVDNIDLPKGMKIEINYDDKSIFITTSMEIIEPRNVLTLRNTVDEILQHISSVERTLTKLSS